MKLESYQANVVIVNMNTNPERRGVCGNDGLITFNPPSLRDQFMAEHRSLVAAAEAADKVIKANNVLLEAQRAGDDDAMAHATIELWAEIDRLAAIREAKPISLKA